MALIIRGAVSVRLHGLLKHKYLPGDWGLLYDSTGSRSPYIELYSEQEASSAVHVLVLEHIKFSDKSYQQEETYFNLSIKKEKHHFQFETVEDKDDWVQALCHVSSELWAQRANNLHVADAKKNDAGAGVMNENFLYDSCEKVQQFKVSISPTQKSAAINLHGNYILSPAQNALQMLEVGTLRSVFEWPYNQIRKYGRTRFIFKMEVGRKCATGEGEFEFFTPEGARLTEQISVCMKQAREGISKQTPDKNSNFSSSPTEHIQPPVPRCAVNRSPTPNTSLAESDTDSNASDLGPDKPQSSRDKKSDEKKRREAEKAAAKLKKQQEKEREARERKEREKRKKEAKAQGKQTETFHSDPADSPGHLYEELGDVGQTPPAGYRHRPAGMEPHDRTVLEPPSDSHLYSTADETLKDPWRKQGRPECDQVHTDMKGASQSHISSPQGEDDTYNRLGDFSRQTSAAACPENVYGMASAVDTLNPSRPLHLSAREVEDQYENFSSDAFGEKKAV